MNMLLHGFMGSEFQIFHGDSRLNDWDILHGFHFLSDEGTMAIFLPHGVLFRGDAEAKICLNYHSMEAGARAPKRPAPVVMVVFFYALVLRTAPRSRFVSDFGFASLEPRRRGGFLFFFLFLSALPE